MTTISPSVLRASFKKFLGDERYRKFLEAGTGGRLRYWQEQALMSFRAQHPDWQVTETELTDALDVCPLHEDPLQTGFTESMDGIYFARPDEERLANYPMAPLLPLIEPGYQRVRYCLVCLAEAKRRRRI